MGGISSDSNPILWRPSEERIRDANITRFIQSIRSKTPGLPCEFREFRDWSAEHPEEFWSAVWDFCAPLASRRFDKIIDRGDQMPGARWFSGAELNFARNLLRHSGDSAALISWNERGRQRFITFDELRREVAACAEGLRSLALAPGDRVAALLPNIPEAVIAMLASASLGLVWSSCSPEFSARGALDRFGQISPKVLFAARFYLYKGKVIDLSAKVGEIRRGLPGAKLVTVDYLAGEGEQFTGDASFEEWQRSHSNAPSQFSELPADHPIYILYSSGTTGAPKCIVHGAGGILLEHLKELTFEADLRAGEKLFYATSCGWMMWNWLVSGLAVGATLILYDGFPLARGGDILFDLARDEAVNVFGTSAGFIQKLEEMGKVPAKTHDLSRLRSILSTGSRLKPHSFEYVYSAIADIHLSPIWGGTDLCGCLGGASPVLPVRRDEIQTRGLGLAVDVVDEHGASVRDRPGEVVVRRPFPSMPIQFLDDAGNRRYRAAYFERFGGMWHHGDLAVLTAGGGLTVLGRSDDTLNPAGVRIGAAEVTSSAEGVAGVIEAIAVSQEWKGDERIILFVILSPGTVLDDELRARINAAMPSPRHRPAKIIAVDEFPTTLSGKRSARAVKDAVNGRAPANRDALLNPHSIETIAALPELKRE